jgi:hypothetical protein
MNVSHKNNGVVFPDFKMVYEIPFGDYVSFYVSLNGQLGEGI